MFHVKHWRVPEVPDVSRETFGGREAGQEGRQMFHVKHSPHPPVFHRLGLHFFASTHDAIQQE
jgi:hypothetical protein